MIDIISEDATIVRSSVTMLKSVQPMETQSVENAAKNIIRENVKQRQPNALIALEINVMILPTQYSVLNVHH